MVKLDLGCGTSKREGHIGVDSLNLKGVDVVHNLNKFPYPFKDSEVDEVWMDNVLEHLDDPMKAMEEVYRICRNGAKVFVSVPYFRSFYSIIDPTHNHFFGVNWFNYFDPAHPFCNKYQYTNARFKIEKLEFDREFKKSRISLIHKLIIAIAEAKPFGYESRISHIYPLNSLTYYLTAVK